MTQTYNLRNTALASSIGVTTAANEVEMNTGTAASATLSHTYTSTLEAQTYIFTTPTTEPNSADWPAASAGDPYKIVLDVTVMGTAVALTSATYHRADSATTSVQSVASTGWDSTTGTGLKTNTHTSWDPAAGATGDRFGVVVRAISSSSMSNNTITIGSLNTTTTFAAGPWGAVVVSRVPYSTPYPQLLAH